VAKIISDAELVNQFAQKAMEEPESVITTRAPSDTEVCLRGGFITEDGKLITTAEVRELTGADEEFVSKTGSMAKALNALLERGLVKLGNEEVTRDHLDTLLAGDRDSILIGIRCATFGRDLTLNVKCPNCSTGQTCVINLVDDVPYRELKDKEKDRTWSMNTKRGSVTVSLPNGIVQKKLMDNVEKTSAEINTLLLSGCITSVDGSPSVGAATALSLGMSDRAKVIDEILSRNPGPRLGEVKKACQACGEDIELPLSLADLFRL